MPGPTSQTSVHPSHASAHAEPPGSQPADTNMADLSSKVVPLQPRASLPPIPEVVPAGVDVPFTSNQRAMVTLHNRGMVGNRGFTITFSDVSDVAALQTAFVALQQHHPILRCSLQEMVLGGDALPVLAHHLQVGPRLPTLQNASCPDEDRPGQLRQFMSEPFPGGALFNARLLVAPGAGTGSGVFAMSLHPAICDDTSLRVLARDFLMLHQKVESSEPAVLDHGVQSFLPRAHWYDQNKGAIAEQSRDFWRSMLAGRDQPALWQDVHFADVPPHTVASHVVQGTPALWRMTPSAASAAASAAEAVSPPEPVILQLSAFALLLSRHMGSSQVCIGFVDGHRPEGSEHTVGSLENTLMLRLALDPGMTVQDLFHHVQAQVDLAREGSALEFGELVTLLDKPNVLQPAGETVVHAAFHWVEAGSGEVSGATFTVLDAQKSFFPFALCVDAAKGEAHIQYARAHFSADRVATMGAHYEALQRALTMPANVDSALNTVEMLSQEERADLLRGFGEQVSLEGVPTLHGAITRVASSQAGKTALIDFPGGYGGDLPPRQITFSTLEEETNRWAHFLREKCQGAEMAWVGVCMARGSDVVKAMLATNKAGYGFVLLPSSDTTPVEDFLGRVKAHGISLIITDGGATRLIEALDGDDAAVTVVDTSDSAMDAHTAVAPIGDAVTLEDLAYGVSTSGTTGTPKHMRIHHGALANWFHPLAQFGFGSHLVGLSLAPVVNDPFIADVLFITALGGQLYIPPEDTAKDPEQLVALMASSDPKINFLMLTPSMCKAMLEKNTRVFEGLEMVVLQGEALPPELVEQLHELNVKKIINGYGPTEWGIGGSMHEAKPGEPITIGRPNANTRWVVLTGDNQLAPIGCVGTLWCQTPGMATTYLDERQNRGRFMPNPFGEGVLHCAGDSAVWAAPGDLRLLGRTDDLIKIKGQMISPQRVETAVMRFEGIADAVVVKRHDEARGEDRLVCYYTSASAAAIDHGALFKALQGALNTYEVPSCFQLVPAFPMTGNGKVDRKALPEPVFTSGDVPNVPFSRRDRFELRVKQIFMQVLGVSELGKLDNFFLMGGDSLMAQRLVHQLGETFASHRGMLTVAWLYEHPSPEHVLELVKPTVASSLDAGSAVPR